MEHDTTQDLTEATVNAANDEWKRDHLALFYGQVSTYLPSQWEWVPEAEFGRYPDFLGTWSWA